MSFLKTIIGCMAFSFCVSNANAQSIGSLSQFIPDDAEVLVALQPEKLLECPIGNWIVSREVIEKHVPPSLGKVDWIILAGKIGSINQLTYTYESSFADIAADIDAAVAAAQNAANDRTDLVPTRPTEKTRAVKMNLDVLAIIRFDRSLTNEAITNWLGDETMQAVNRDRFEVFQNDSDECCKVVRIDEQTIVVGGRKDVDAALARVESKSLLAQSLNDELVNREFTLSCDLRKDGSNFAMMMPGLEDVKSISMNIDLTGPELLKFTGELANEEQATKLLATAQQLFSEYEEQAEIGIHAMSSNLSKEDSWVPEQVLQLLLSAKITKGDRHVDFTIDRPENFNELVAKVDELARRIEQEAHSQFQQIANELEAVEE